MAPAGMMLEAVGVGGAVGVCKSVKTLEPKLLIHWMLCMWFLSVVCVIFALLMRLCYSRRLLFVSVGAFAPFASIVNADAASSCWCC